MRTSEHTLEGIATGAFFALILAFIINALFPFLPIMTVFSIFMLFFALQIMEAHFSGGILGAIHLTKKFIRAIAGGLAFFIVRFIIGMVIKVYPVEAYRQLGDSGGFAGAFWGTGDYRVLAIEIVLLTCIALAVFGNSKLLRYSMGFLIVAWAILPLTTEASLARRTVMDQKMAASISQKGIIGAISSPVVGAVHEVAADVTIPAVIVSPALDQRWGNVKMQVCDEAWEKGDIITTKIPAIDIVPSPMQPNCFGRTVDLPETWSHFCYEAVPFNNPDPNWHVAIQFLDANDRVLETDGYYTATGAPQFRPLSRRMRFEGSGSIRLYPGGCKSPSE